MMPRMPGRRRVRCLVVAAPLVVLATPRHALAEERAWRDPTAPREEPPAVQVKPIAYVEAFYQYNLNRPDNGITHHRGFDNRAGSITLSNVALGLSADAPRFTGTVILQVGHTPATYYLAETESSGAAGTNASSGRLFQYLQEAHAGWKAPVGRGLLLEGGLFPSPIGPEVLAAKDNWTFSRSNLFFGLPYYHVGVRAKYTLSDRLSSTVALFNGWNSIVDANEDKSLAWWLAYEDGSAVNAQLLYFAGTERPSGAPEGPNVRHMFDGFAKLEATSWLDVMAHANGGFEPTRFGTSTWYGGAVYARARAGIVSLALRADQLREQAAASGDDRAQPLFFSGARWVGSGTATGEVRPLEGFAVRLEYRHDEADSPLYFRGASTGNGSTGAPFIPNTPRQDTVTVAVLGWLP